MKSYQRQIYKAKNKSTEGMLMSYDDAADDVREYVGQKMTSELKEKLRKKHTKHEIEKKDKSYLRDQEAIHRKLIEDCINEHKIRVMGFENRMGEFTDLMVSEFVGYSVLETAFKDPTVSDIFVLNYNNIFVEQNGVNVRYPFVFRSPAHCEEVIKRFVREDKQELNNGDSKIVNFEMYEDRGCAISPVIASKGYTVTLRKHEEDHITLQNLLDGGVINEEIADLLGMLIDGETNIICAGLTGSGKTTTIRALIDDVVPKNNKRMLVCEDTPELFPKNPHTLELTSMDTGDPTTSVTLRELIYTALRLKPKYIVVGEVRGEEAEAAVEAMETGHSTIFTMHAGTSINAINRLVTKYLMAMPTLGTDVVERIVGSAVDYIFIQDNIPGIGRKVTKLDEISYDFETSRVSVRNIFEFDFMTKDWKWNTRTLGDLQADKMLRRGVPLEKIKPWLAETA